MPKRRKARTSSPASAGADAPRDYVAIAVAYARKASAPRTRHKYGRWARLACERFLRDLKTSRQKRAPYRFDAWEASQACQFVELLPHVEGNWSTANLLLHDSHVFLLVNLFGFRRPSGVRRFTTALYAVGRKNAKSTLAAGIGLYCEVAEGEIGPQVISAATTAKQARVVFDIAFKMVQATPDLRERFELEPFVNGIACYQNRGSFKPINAKASTQDGLNPSAVVFDELHAHKTHDLLNVVKSSVGGRHNQLFLFVTTEGYPNPGPWAEERHFAQQVLQGILEAEHYFCLIHALDDDDEDFDEKTWIKANPLIEVNPELLDKMRALAIEAKAKPGLRSEFLIKRLNRQAGSAKGAIDIPKWRKCDGRVALDELVGYPCWMGLDLSATRDLTSARLVWRLPNGRYATWGRRWVPEGAVHHRTERGTVDYAGWVEGGLVEQTPGDSIDYDLIAAGVRQMADRFKPRSIAYDSWKAEQVWKGLDADNYPLVEFRQGPKSFDPAWNELERTYIAGRLAHGGDPVLAWCASNLVLRKDENENVGPSKKRSADKIDDLVALLMAVGAALRDENPGSLDNFLKDPIHA